MDREQPLIDHEVILSRCRFLRALASQICEEADVTRWQAKQECGYSFFLLRTADEVQADHGRHPAIRKGRFPPIKL